MATTTVKQRNLSMQASPKPKYQLPAPPYQTVKSRGFLRQSSLRGEMNGPINFYLSDTSRTKESGSLLTGKKTNSLNLFPLPPLTQCGSLRSYSSTSSRLITLLGFWRKSFSQSIEELRWRIAFILIRGLWRFNFRRRGFGGEGTSGRSGIRWRRWRRRRWMALRHPPSAGIPMKCCVFRETRPTRRSNLHTESSPSSRSLFVSFLIDLCLLFFVFFN